MDTDVRLLRVKGSTASPARGYLTASQLVHFYILRKRMHLDL